MHLLECKIQIVPLYFESKSFSATFVTTFYLSVLLNHSNADNRCRIHLIWSKYAMQSLCLIKNKGIFEKSKMSRLGKTGSMWG